ncbi:MAG: OmpH family outer membrane protein [Flavobacteriales bacterium]|nr:OmpH family outer membrane protein [Flavobacteriales bacterium]
MKNASLLINALLAVAVGVLYFLHFSSGSKAPETTSTVNMAAVDSISSFMRIAYVNTDSLWEKYEKIAVLQKELESERAKSEKRILSRTKTLEAQFKEMMTALQKKAQDFEGSSKGMSELIYNTKMRELQELEQNARQFEAQASEEVADLQQTLTNQLLEQEANGTKEINERLKAYIKEYNADKGFTYVLAYSSEAGGILLGDPALDITADVVTGLNAIYSAEVAAQKKDEEKK